MSANLHTLGVVDLMEQFADLRASPVDAVIACIAQTDATNPLVNAVITRLDESALQAAEESAQRYRRGTQLPLDGVPFGVKDIVALQGHETTGGSSLYRGWIPAGDATVVRRLKEAGAIPLAKHTTLSFAMGDLHNQEFGPTRNPWDTTRTTGGSSSGSGAAVAARQVPFSIGTDTGGSIRMPATWCGLSGLKPTFGAVPLDGVMPLAWSLDTIGPLARSAQDAREVMRIIAGPSETDPRARIRLVDTQDGARRDLVGLRIGIPQNWFSDLCDAEVVASYTQAQEEFRELGATLVPVRVEHADKVSSVARTILYAELASAHEDNLKRITEYEPSFAAHILNGRTITATEYLRAQRIRGLMQREYASILRNVDLIMTPANVAVAPKLDELLCWINGEGHVWTSVVSRTLFAASLTGNPALVVPSGITAAGLPMGVQIIGPPGSDFECLAAGVAFQSRTGHHLREPVAAGGQTASH